MILPLLSQPAENGFSVTPVEKSFKILILMKANSYSVRKKLQSLHEKWPCAGSASQSDFQYWSSIEFNLKFHVVKCATTWHWLDIISQMSRLRQRFQNRFMKEVDLSICNLQRWAKTTCRLLKENCKLCLKKNTTVNENYLRGLLMTLENSAEGNKGKKKHKLVFTGYNCKLNKTMVQFHNLFYNALLK